MRAINAGLPRRETDSGARYRGRVIAVLNTMGLSLNAAGVVLLFYFGMRPENTVTRTVKALAKSATLCLRWCYTELGTLTRWGNC